MTILLSRLKRLCDYRRNSRPRVCKLTNGITALKFDVMKRIPAAYIIETAILQKRIDENTTIIETTSGTMGVGLAEVCSILGLKLILVSDSSMKDNTYRICTDLGAKVDIVEMPDREGSYQLKRLERIKQYREQFSNHFFVNQYDNPLNALAYSEIVTMFLEADFPIPDLLVCPIGSGGSSNGLIKHFRMIKPEMKLVGVDTFNSVLFGLKDGERSLRGLGNSVMPQNFSKKLFDQCHWITKDIAANGMKILHSDYGLYCGLTSGASFVVAQHLEKTGEENIVCVFPDNGYRYNYSETTAFFPTPHHVNDVNMIKLPWTAMELSRSA